MLGPCLRQGHLIAITEVADHAAQLRLQLRRLIEHVARNLAGVMQRGHFKQNLCCFRSQAGERAQLVSLRRARA